MAEIRKRIFIVLAIVVALVRAIDVACVGNLGDEFQALNSNGQNTHNSKSTLVTTDGNTDYVSRSYDTAPSIGGRFKAISYGIMILLLIVAVVGTMGYNVSSIVSPKKDIFEKSLTLESSMNELTSSDSDNMRNISRQLSLPLSNSGAAPQQDSISGSLNGGGFGAIGVDTIGIINNGKIDARPSGEICSNVARIVYDMIEDKVSNARMSVFELDTDSDYDVNAMKTEIAKTSTATCGEGFFEIVQLHNGSGVSFNSENSIVKETIDNFECKQIAKKVVPMLNDLGIFLPEIDGRNTITSTPEIRSLLKRRLKLPEGKSCGDNFYVIKDSTPDSLAIVYENSNYYISQAWNSFIEDPKCQAAADAIIPILHKLGGRTSKTNAKNTILNSKNVRSELINGSYLARDCGCGYGFINLDINEENVVVTYRNTNRFIVEAWKKSDMKNIPACKTAVEEIVPFLRALNLFSPEADGSLVIPDEGKNIRNLIQKLRSAEEVNCGDGFFTRVDENGEFKLNFNKENIYIKPHWV